MIALAGQLIGLGVVAPLYSFLSLLPAPPPSDESLPSHHSNLAPTISTPLLTRDPSPSSSTSSSPSRGGGRRTLNPFHLLPASSRKPPTPPDHSPSTTLLPALVLAYYLPAALMLFHPVASDRQAWLFVWQLFPVYLAVASFVLSRIPLRLPGKRAERTAMQKLDAEVRGARVCVGVLVALAVGAWWWTWVGSGASVKGMVGLFVPKGMPAGELPSLEGFAAEFLRWDEMFVFAGVLGWLGYLFADLGVVRGVVGWVGVVGGGLASVVVLGPGATAGLWWLWRGEVMFKRREKEVLLREVEAKVEELLRANGA